MKTLLSKERVDSLLTFAEITKDIPGVIAEIGVSEGGMVALFAGQCKSKKIYAIDTFDGTPREKITPDIDAHRACEFRPENPNQTIATLKAFSNVEIIQGIFPEVMALTELAFSLVHIDVDIYKSTLDALKYVWPRLSPGGIVAIDDWDWGPCKGVQRAADEFFDKLGMKMSVSPATVVNGIKQAFIVKPGDRVYSKNNSQNKTASGIVFVTAFDDAMAGPGTLAVNSAVKYCHKHGYRLRRFPELLNNNLAPSWNKIAAMLEVMSKEPDGQWIWWFDADMLFSDVHQNAFDLLSGHNGKLFVFSTDWNGLCCCTFAVCNCKATRSIMESMIHLGDVSDHQEFGEGCGIKWEQNSFKKLIKSYPSLSRLVGYMPLDVVREHPEQDIEPSKQFFMHFSLMSNNERESRMRRRIMWEQLKEVNQ